MEGTIVIVCYIILVMHQMMSQAKWRYGIRLLHYLKMKDINKRFDYSEYKIVQIYLLYLMMK